MGSSPEERLAVLETEVRHIKAASSARSTREWAVFMAVLALLLAILSKNMGWIN